MPSRAQIEAAIRRLPPEKHKEFLAEVRRRMANDNTPQLKPQQERGVVSKARDWLVGLASDLRIRDEERAGLREAGVGLVPTTREEVGAAMLPLAPIGIGTVPTATSAAMALAGGSAGAHVGSRAGRNLGEAVGPGLGDVGSTAGAVVGGAVGGGVASGAPAMARGTARGIERAVPGVARAAEQGGRSVVTTARRHGGPIVEMAAEGALDTTLGLIPGGGIVSGAIRRLVARPIMKTVLKAGTRKLQDAATPRGTSPTMGTTSRTAAPPGGLPARATLTRIPKAPKRPGIPRMQGGSKAQRAWMESQGLIPGAMGPDDVVAMRARGATADEIEAALLRASRPSEGWGSPTPKVGEKAANWKPAAAGENWKPPAEANPSAAAVKAGLPKKLTENEHRILMRLQGLAKSSGNRAAIKQAVRETFGDDWKSVWEFIMAPVTRAS